VRRRGFRIFPIQSAHRWRWDCQPYPRTAIWIRCQNRNITRTYGLPHIISLQRARRAVYIRHTLSSCFPLKFYTNQGRQPYGTIMLCQYTYVWVGRAMAETVSRWLSTASARVRAHVRSCGICGGQSGTGAGFLPVLRFPLPIIIPPTAPHSSVTRAWYNGPVSGRSTKWTQSRPTPRYRKKRLSLSLEYEYRTHVENWI
jgi:hypothetical protein